MAKRFEELAVWQKARELTSTIYSLTKKPGFSRDYGLVDQIRRAAVSVMSNIAEGFERGGKEELIQFLYIAKASCGEVRSQLYIARDLGYIAEQELTKTLSMAETISKQIYYFIESVKGSRYKGLKFKPTRDAGQEELFKLMRDSIPKQYWSEDLKRSAP